MNDLKKHWFVLNGYATSGKDEVKRIINTYVPSKSISSVDVIKHICFWLGWDGEKDEAGRLALSEFKALSEKHFDHPFEYVKSELDKFKKSKELVVFTVDVREPQNIKRLVDELDFKTIFVENNNITHIPDNNSDNNVEDYLYDFIINNNGTLEDLNISVKSFLDDLK